MSDEKKKEDGTDESGRVLNVDEDVEIKVAIERMVSREVSSILVINSDEIVTGIITERDIVRKFTLLEVEDKFSRKVNTFMNRPVHFVKQENMLEEMKRLHLEKGIRHFPILDGDEPKIDNIKSLATVTDLFQQMIADSGKKKKKDEVAETPLGLVAKTPELMASYRKIFKEMGYKITAEDDFHQFMRSNPDMKMPLIFDLDLYKENELKNIVPVIGKYRGDLIIVTSNPALVTMFRKFLKGSNKIAAVKPLDFSYCDFLIRVKWANEEHDSAA